jgi:NAD(P)-dependent dehydrogenase (short-subunit alcohol dehydrogenase family)
MAKQVIAVVGGTGGQGGGVVDALLASGKFTVRVASRNPLSDAAKALANSGVEVIKADLLDAASEVGRAVAAAFGAGDKLPSGSYLAVCGGVYSWNDFVATLNAQGHDLQVTRVPPEAYDSFYPGAREIREMYQYYEQHTYFGPAGQKRIAAANGLVPGGFTGFADWAKVHMKPT